MENISENYYVAQSDVFELLALKFRSNNHEYMQAESHRAKESFNQFIHDAVSLVSDAVKEELDCFFHQDSFFGLTFVQLLYQHDKWHDIPDFLNFLEQLECEEIISAFLTSGYPSPERIGDYNDEQEVFSHIQASLLPFPEQAKLFYLYFDKENTKRRLLKLVEEINEKIFQPFKEKLGAYHEDSIQKLLKMDEKHVKKLIQPNFDQPNANLPNKMIIIPSYFYYTSTLFSYGGKNDAVISLAGMERIEQIMDESKEEDRVIDLAKALSDRTKIKIIKRAE
ncbi:hypothetical protein [Oceanobacillus sp. CFH 90083]|uniref:hypothetical protein n=1 Tax=Oceanobacillus sp. CFH 90083 TaxID=2592336 RepID=UPI00128D32C9|nr:hypothetical protein [Oceanobacillus sp. CFH 90083]